MKSIFRLQTLLNWKQSLEEISRLNLARLRIQHERQEEEIQALLALREENDRTLRASMERGTSGKEVRLFKQFAEEGYQNRVRMEAQKEEIERKIEKERDRVVQLMKERKILEKLKEHRFRSLLREMARKEQKDLDERAIRERGERPGLWPPLPE